MNRYISIPIKPVSGSPYEKLVNVSSIVVQKKNDNAALVVAQNMYNQTQEWTFNAMPTSSGTASSDDVCGWMGRALLAFNGVSGPVQKVLDSPNFYFRTFSYT
ncbi:hypothetical protein N9242_04075 [Vicingaceae bacterium]|nr:hypothetical protein [Vicingaceae bacterium]